MAQAQDRGMAKSRALLTETEREQIAGEHGDNRKYQAASRIRSRIDDELPQDIEVLKEHHPDLLAELQDVVCEESTRDGDPDE
jgi:hypothetical protein